MPSVLEQLCSAQVYTKLDSLYNLIHIKESDEWKMMFSMVSGQYQYQVLQYSVSIMIVVPLTTRLEKSHHKLFLNPAAKSGINQLKNTFNTAAMLKHPDPE